MRFFWSLSVVVTLLRCNFSTAFASWFYEQFACRSECCIGTHWIDFNATGLKKDLEENVFGQHIAVDVITKILKSHARQGHEAQKALVLSFEGGTGSGKNYVSHFIAKNWFRKGMGSDYVRQIIATKEYQHESKLEEYKEHLRNMIVEAGKACGRFLFVFDEMDKMPLGLVDVIYPFVDYHHAVDGVDFRQGIFIFLSNSRAAKINKYMLEQYKKGIRREDIKVRELDHILSVAAFNEKDGSLWHSRLISNHLIDYFVPFLPLERRHVKLCAEAEMKRKDMFLTQTVINRVADELTYWPEDEKLYSSSGCKKITTKVAIHSYDP
ncbi:torsin-1A-like [Oscarella lobularis]|uniref:torsin-1A-like n=1 Tax=Oscarella lobularis TaxID=121494 RepID=UPI0033144C9E